MFSNSFFFLPHTKMLVFFLDCIMREMQSKWFKHIQNIKLLQHASCIHQRHLTCIVSMKYMNIDRRPACFDHVIAIESKLSTEDGFRTACLRLQFDVLWFQEIETKLKRNSDIRQTRKKETITQPLNFSCRPFILLLSGCFFFQLVV